MVDSNVKHTPTSSAKDYWQLLGMRCDPFGDESAEGWYFAGADRDDLLQSALRITRFATQVMVLAGTQGVGKSKLLEALMERLDGVSAVLGLQGSFMLTVEQLFDQIGDKLGLQASRMAANELRGQTLRQLESGLPHSRSFIVLVDDAHELPERTLESLLTLAQDDGNSIKLLLFAATDANGDLRAELVSDAIQRVDIVPLDLNGVEEYLRYRLTMAGYAGLFPFTQADLLSVFQHSGGIPEHMHAMAEQKVRAAVTDQAQSSPPTPPTPPTKTQIPWLHVAASLALVIFIAALWSAGDDTTEPDQRRIKIPVADNVATLPKPKRPELAAPPSQDRAPARQAENQQADSQTAGSEQLGNSAPATIERSLPPEEPPPSAVAEGEAPAEPAEETAVADAPAELPVDNPSETAENSAPLNTSAYTSDERYLLNLPASHYTLQLLGSKSQQGVEDFASSNKSSKIIVFRQLLNNKPWYVAVIGEYPNQEKAITALARLPKTLRELKPWARPLSKVQGDIRAAGAAR